MLEGDVYVTGAGPFGRAVTFHNAGEYPPPAALPKTPVSPSGGRPLQ